VPAGGADLAHGEAKFGGILQLVPELGAEDSGEDDEGYDVEGVSVDAVADEVEIEDVAAENGGEPEEESEGSQLEGADVDVRVHMPRMGGYALVFSVGSDGPSDEYIGWAEE